MQPNSLIVKVHTHIFRKNIRRPSRQEWRVVLLPRFARYTFARHARTARAYKMLDDYHLRASHRSLSRLLLIYD